MLITSDMFAFPAMLVVHWSLASMALTCFQTHQKRSRKSLVQELYGPETAGVMLSAFSRVLTGYLQMRGFTCGIDDLLLVPGAEQERARIVSTAEAAALKASADLVGHPHPPDPNADTTVSIGLHAALPFP